VFKRSRKRLVRYGLLTANVLILIGVVVFVTGNQSSGEIARQSAAANSSQETAANPLDQVSSADIAVHVAHMTALPETRSVENHADTFNAQLTMTASADETIVAKPQIVSTGVKTSKDIKKYTVKEGDTVSSIAQAFGITSDSVRWSNGLTGERVAAGKVLTIPPINGIVYTVKTGDTLDTLAAKYSASKEQIAEFNDAELAGIKTGQKILIPNGVQQAARSSGGYSSGGFAWGGYTAVYSANGYDYGWCTWWAAKRRADIGRPVPSNLGNAVSWARLAQRAGIPVNGTPASGDVAYYRSIGGLGHVGFVERVNPDGSIWISDMNYFGVSQIGGSTPAGGWGRTSYHLVPASGTGSYLFIH
jgi:N-acetylmuramoyl-L-alanine amidase